MPKGHSHVTKKRDITLVFGAFNLDQHNQPETFSLSPHRIHIHKDWNPHNDNFDADIAMISTEEEVPMMRTIRPICLWDFLQDANNPAAIIAGWGTSLKGFEPLPKQLEVPIVTADVCLSNNSLMASMSSVRTFCAGSRTQAGPCFGKILTVILQTSLTNLRLTHR